MRTGDDAGRFQQKCPIIIGLVMAGEVAKRAGWNWPEELTIVGTISCLAFLRICFRMNAAQRARVNIKIGSETLPPAAEIARVTVGGVPISDVKKDVLLKALLKAKRASRCGKPSQEIPFQIEDRWGGIWNLQAYSDDQGNRGFSINQVYYSGSQAKLVAECVGLPR